MSEDAQDHYRNDMIHRKVVAEWGFAKANNVDQEFIQLMAQKRWRIAIKQPKSKSSMELLHDFHANVANWVDNAITIKGGTILFELIDIKQLF